VEVTGVVDGDTIDTSIGRVRFFGVDTPERGEECFTEATDFTRLLVGSQVRLEDGPRLEDTYGRRLAYVFDSSGISIDAQLIAGGFATAWTRDGQHKDVLVGLEENAVTNGRGCLWSDAKAIVVYEPTEADFLRAWGAKVPQVGLPRDVDSTFRQYVSLWTVESAIASEEMNKVSFTKFVSGATPEIYVRSFAAFYALLKHPDNVVQETPWIYRPETREQGLLGCGLAYTAAKQRFGSWLGTLGTLVEYCDQRAWNNYLAFGETDSDWIEFLKTQLFG
jgi:hypothetical protein